MKKEITKKVFIYVGHARWGKSLALRVVTRGNPYAKLVQINRQWVLVRKMSNDDQEEKMLTYVNHLRNRQYDNFILTYCPKQDTERGAMRILNSLQRSCQLYFFVQESRFSDPSQIVTPAQIAYLRSIGTVQILRGNQPYTVRAARFLRFIRHYI